MASIRLKQFGKNLLVCLSVIFCVTGSKAQKTHNAAPLLLQKTAFRYNLNEPEVITLPVTLNEISGMSYDGATNTVFAVDDEQGSLFNITLQKEPVIQQWPVSQRLDYEGLAMVDNMVYLLSSPGSIVYFPQNFPVAKWEQVRLGQKGRNEFEILFKDPAADRLLMICKSCKEDRKGDVSAYAFNLATKRFEATAVASVKTADIERLLKERVGQFKPSAANVHPLTGEIYMVSSINKLLVIMDRDFGIREVHKLRPELFKQPEGICFTPAGDMLISNEAAGKGAATILVFRQK
jgi:uncharacterized protein YjiK